MTQEYLQPDTTATAMEIAKRFQQTEAEEELGLQAAIAGLTREARWSLAERQYANPHEHIRERIKKANQLSEEGRHYEATMLLGTAWRALKHEDIGQALLKALTRQATGLIEAGLYQEAQELLEGYENQGIVCGPTYHALANAYRMQGDYTRGVMAALQAVQFIPQQAPQFHAELALNHAHAALQCAQRLDREKEKEHQGYELVFWQQHAYLQGVGTPRNNHRQNKGRYIWDYYYPWVSEYQGKVAEHQDGAIRSITIAVNLRSPLDVVRQALQGVRTALQRTTHIRPLPRPLPELPRYGSPTQEEWQEMKQTHGGV